MSEYEKEVLFLSKCLRQACEENASLTNKLNTERSWKKHFEEALRAEEAVNGELRDENAAYQSLRQRFIACKVSNKSLSGQVKHWKGLDVARREKVLKQIFFQPAPTIEELTDMSGKEMLNGGDK